MRVVSCVVLLVAALGLSSIARADEAIGPGAFYGRYVGTGIARDPNVMAFGFNQRDFNVEIGSAENGFFVAWTTVMQPRFGKEAKRKSTRVTFEPSTRPGIYIEHAPAIDPAHGASWASISNRALTVRILTILDDGTYELQSYQRSLAKDGLYLTFRSDQDGGLIRIVTAYLKKEKQ